jgi:geranylgeranyl diphosphate synthase, type II
MDIEAYFVKTSALVEKQLDALIPEQKHTPYHSLFQSARYSLLSGGKRLRPILTVATAETFGITPEEAVSTACAVEMVHTYSLIHDDLPCMDDDDFRRGKPSLHKAYGEGLAVLAGDYLLTYAFETIAHIPHLTAEQKIALVSLLAKNSGCKGMIAGQVMDIQAEGKQIDLAALKTIHQYKTGALINTAILGGGIVAQAKASELQMLGEFGQAVGLAFQIIDDVIDVTSSEEKHGKKLGSDAAKNKTTYVTLMGIEGAKQEATQLLNQALTYLQEIPHDTSLLKNIAKRLVHRRF